MCCLFFRRREGAAALLLLSVVASKSPLRAHTELCFDASASLLKTGRQWSALQVIQVEFLQITQTDLP